MSGCSIFCPILQGEDFEEDDDDFEVILLEVDISELLLTVSDENNK